MPYNKYIWQTGEVITAPKLNHIENGIADINSVVIDAEYVPNTLTTGSYCKTLLTCGEIKALLESDSPPVYVRVFRGDSGGGVIDIMPIVSFEWGEGYALIVAYMNLEFEKLFFTANSESDYMQTESNDPE